MYDEIMEGDEILNLIFDIFPPLLISCIFLYILVIRLFSKLTEVTQEKILRLVFISSPIWLVLSLYQLVFGISAIGARQADLSILLLTLSAFYILFAVYFLLAGWPATFAYVIIHGLGELFSKKEIHIHSFWFLLNKVKTRRFLTLIFLFTLLLSIIFLDCLLFFSVSVKHLNLSLPATNFLVALGLVLLFIYLIEEIVTYGRVNIPRSEHKKSIDLKRAIENLSIAAGVQPPDFEILANSNPTAFSLSPNFGRPTIFVTTSLLNLANKEELEAIIGHQVANIFSGRILNFKMINNILIALRISVFLLFFLFLSNLNLLAIWLVILLITMIYPLFMDAAVRDIQTGMLQGRWFGEANPFLRTVITLFNPPFLFVNFISYLVYYVLSFNEVFYADLKTVQLTRYPKGLYTIIEKIEEYRDADETLPEKFFYLYFTGENTIYSQIPTPQPPIEKRKDLLEEIDYTLKNLDITRETTDLKCPYCLTPMVELKTSGHYGVLVKIDRCPKCGSVWFDSWELYYVAGLSTFSLDKTQMEKITAHPDEFSCPRCGIKLFLMDDPNIPHDVQIWRCESCKGNWLEYEHLSQYVEHRKRTLEKNRRMVETQ